MESDKSELQTTAFHCMKHFITGVTLEKEKVCFCMIFERKYCQFQNKHITV